MPTYDYKCKKCGKIFETQHGIDEKVDECVFCGGPVRRVFHPVGVVFKGPGFYSTDSRTEKGEKMEEPKKTKPAEKKKESKESESSKNNSKPDK